MVITVETLLEHYTQGYELSAWCPRCDCTRSVDLAKLIRNGKGQKSVRELRIRHGCGATMKLQRSPPTRPRTRERPTAQLLSFEKPKR
jgi:hypothetical protein